MKDALRKLEFIFPGEGTRVENTRAEVFNLFIGGKGNEGKTRADLLNGVTEFVTWNRSSRIHKGVNEDEMKFESLMLGTGLKIQERALEVITN
jgi:hypothetical protein